MSKNEQLIERYVHAVVRDTPEQDRADIANELRSTIADMVEGHMASGMDAEEAERRTLTGLGSPAAMAAKYHPGATTLISPRYYFVWKRVLLTILMWVVPIVMVLASIGNVIDGDTDVVEIFVAALGAGMTAAVYVCFWTTVAFVLVDRATAADGKDEWSVDLLPTLPVLPNPAPGPSRGDAISGAVFSLVLAVLLLLQDRFIWIKSSEPIPLFDRDLWSFWLPWLIVMCLVSAVLELWKYRTSWTGPTVILTVIMSLAFSVPVAYLAATNQLLSPEFIEQVRLTSTGLEITNMSIAIGACIVVLIEAGEALLGYFRRNIKSRPIQTT